MLVDAVEDAEEHLAPGPQQAVETDAVLFGLDLARVSRADGGDGVGVEDPGRKKRKAARAQIVLVDQPGLTVYRLPG